MNPTEFVKTLRYCTSRSISETIVLSIFERPIIYFVDLGLQSTSIIIYLKITSLLYKRME